MKYALEFKLECIDKYKKGIHIDVPPNCKSSHRDFMNGVRNWAKTYDKLGMGGLKHSVCNRRWTAEERFKIVAQTLTGKPLIQAALENGVNVGQLCRWAKIYREKGMDGLELRKGRKPKEPDMPKKKKIRLAPSEREELELLRARNEYLEAENVYLKKLDALVCEREAAHPKAKKQKSSKK